MTNAEKLTLAKHACHIRMGVIEGTHSAKCGHPGGSLDIAELLSYLYFVEMNIDPKDPKMADRDRLVLSKGHAAPALYAALAERGYFPVEDLKTLRKIGSYLQGHPNMNETPGVDMSTGSLGQGASTATGAALGNKIDGRTNHVFCVIGDGEADEGQVWESFQFAYAHKLDNLIYFIDKNGYQLDGPTADILDHGNIAKKAESFGLYTQEIDGHDVEQIEAAFTKARETKGVPFAIVMKTTKGKGVSFMENQAGWHGKAPNDEEYEIAMKELSAQLAEVEAM